MSFNKPLFLHLTRQVPPQEVLSPSVMSPPLTPDRLQYYETENTAALVSPSFAPKSFGFDVHDYFDNHERRKGSVQDALSRSIALSPAVHPESHLYIVEFKAGRRDIFYLPFGTTTDPVLREGDCVIVEADRGTDLGKLVEITNQTVSDILQSPQHPFAQPLLTALTTFALKRVYRVAHSAEILMIVAKSEDEAAAMRVAQDKANGKGLAMDIVNVEYQWDRRKLTFFYVSMVYIDFRELVRELYRIYKTRIWFVRYNDTKQ